MFERTSRRALVVLVGTLALTRCSGGNDVAGVNTGRASGPPTPTALPMTPTSSAPRINPTPRPCPPRFGNDCGGLE